MMSRNYKTSRTSRSLFATMGVLLSALASASAKAAQRARNGERDIEASVVATNHDCRDTLQQLYHTNITAPITGPKADRFPLTENGPGLIEKTAAPDRLKPFRKITVRYQESQDMMQPFPRYYDPALGFTPSKGAGGSAISNGVAGTDTEILTYRSEVASLWDCAERKFEESFLSFRAAGDPAMLVDVLANPSRATSQNEKTLLDKQPAGDSLHSPKPGLKATRSFFPNDLSNVYHSYMTDVVEFRILHAGVSVHHVHLRQTHQRKRDFPLWALRRARDVFEAGTPLYDTGRPSLGARALNQNEMTPAAFAPVITLLSNSGQRAIASAVAI